MSNFGLVPILLIVGILVLGIRMMKSKNQKSTFIIGRSTHFKIFACFIAVLFVTMVIGEIFHSKINSATPPERIENHHAEQYDSIDDQIINHKPVNPEALIEKRTHPAGKTLTIQWPYDSDPFGVMNSIIYIERKQTDDQTIEEFIYKPLFIVDEYDFSNALYIAKPVWTENTMTLPKNPVNDTTLATFFYDASLLQQLTKNKQFRSEGYSSEYRSLIIHLKIPADLKIVDTNEDFLYFVD